MGGIDWGLLVVSLRLGQIGYGRLDGREELQDIYIVSSRWSVWVHVMMHRTLTVLQMLAHEVLLRSI